MHFTCRRCALPALIWVKGEYRSPASVRLYVSQSASGTRSSCASCGVLLLAGSTVVGGCGNTAGGPDGAATAAACACGAMGKVPARPVIASRSAPAA